jgi:hypothetical protein
VLATGADQVGHLLVCQVHVFARPPRQADDEAEQTGRAAVGGGV